MTEPKHKWFKMDTGDVETRAYNGHWIDVTPETSTLTFDTRELTLDQFILHLLKESDRVTGINAGTSKRTTAIDWLESSIKDREDDAAYKAEVSKLSEKLMKAHEHAQSPLAGGVGSHWRRMAQEFLKL